MANYTPQADTAAALPSNYEAEKSVLGSMFRSSDAVIKAADRLIPNDFYDPINRMIYDVMLSLFNLHRPVDLVTVDEELSKRGLLNTIGGPQYLIDISRSVPSAANVDAYITIIEDKSTLRKLLGASDAIHQNCYSTEKDAKEVLDAAEKAIYDIVMSKGGEAIQPIQPILISTFEKIETLVQNEGRIDGVPTGYRELDNMLTGLHSGEFILIAGRPAMGKTSIGMNIVCNAAIRARKKIAVFSLEMPAEQLAMRMMCTEGHVNMQNVRRGKLTDEEWARLCDAMSIIGQSEIYIDSIPGITVPEVRSKARRIQMEHGLDLILIDYLSLMTSTVKTGSRQEEVAQISRMLKGMALELGVPVIALQQLSRQPVGRANHRPQLSDIRESGAIEQDADVVMFIHREEYYEPETAEPGIAEMIVAKQRNGALGTVKLGWKGEYTWFVDI